MTNAYEIFKQSIIEAKDLLECFITLNSHSELTAPDALKKASLILALTAWETYVEDVITEIFNVKFSMVKGSRLGSFAEKQLKERLKQFHNPGSRKTKQLFEEFFDFDVTAKWIWNNVDSETARKQLNKWISLRGDAVHRVNVDPTAPHIIKKDELAKCIRFIEELVKATDQAVINL
ncbi:hypothetical protein AMBAS45_07535 [Alteromonas macleodii str. 'Balearic Sea AD45']|uniref:HEPN domain-containing protein n=1 Tax=Alteromonas macleodii TaxID=28108 RepID=UPI000286D569|nr:HEPN domain-containing protein [Alteromonas macleodii]AFT94982.1 hypothetical protein AMBAS45_07535 [Alteromonas macleodii str. 'Balearic Sea AD45']